jgi:hypothetical protein
MTKALGAGLLTPPLARTEGLAGKRWARVS